MFQRKSRHINEVNHTIYVGILIPHQQMKDASMSPWKFAFVQCFRVKSGCNHQIYHYTDVILTTITSQITSLTVVYSTVYSDADQRKHQRSASLSFVWGIHRDRWIPRTKGQLRGKCFHLMTSSCGGVTTWHCSNVIMSSIRTQINGVSIVYSTVYSGADQRNTKASRHWIIGGN